MRKTTPLFILLGLQLLSAVLSVLFLLAVRPGLIATYQEAAVALRLLEQLALSLWFLPLVTVIASLITATGFLPQVKSARRLRRVATGLTVQALVGVAAALMALYPMLRG